MRRQPFFLLALALVASMPAAGFSDTSVSIDQACADCKAAGNKPPGKPVQSALKKETSLIGLAYLTYIYQNDLSNEHFCQAIVLMSSQVPLGTENPYIHLFDEGMGEKTLGVMQDIQLSFDYAIGRSSPSSAKMKASIKNIQAVLNTNK
jgi:hypothetical protein